MSIHRRAARRDSNEDPIVRALHDAGALVQKLSAPGVPDLLVLFRGVLYLLETKTTHGTLTPVQVKWHEQWCEAPIFIVRTVEDALRAIGALKE